MFELYSSTRADTIRISDACCHDYTGVSGPAGISCPVLKSPQDGSGGLSQKEKKKHKRDFFPQSAGHKGSHELDRLQTISPALMNIPLMKRKSTWCSLVENRPRSVAALSDPLVTALASIALIYLPVNGRLQEQTAAVLKAAKTQSGFRERGRARKGFWKGPALLREHEEKEPAVW